MARNAFGPFDDRNRASMDLGVSFARYGLTGPGFADGGMDATADREVREVGLGHRPKRYGELGLEFGLDLGQEADRGGLALDDATLRLEYELQF